MDQPSRTAPPVGRSASKSLSTEGQNVSARGKIAVITGANSGIGLATAKTFLDEVVARVYITGRRKSELDAAVTALGKRAIAVPSDVTKPADLDRLYDQVKNEVGHVDIVFANAGFAAPALCNLVPTPLRQCLAVLSHPCRRLAGLPIAHLAGAAAMYGRDATMIAILKSGRSKDLENVVAHSQPGYSRPPGTSLPPGVTFASNSFGAVPIATVEGTAVLTRAVAIYDITSGAGAGTYQLSASNVRGVDGSNVSVSITDASGSPLSSRTT